MKKTFTLTILLLLAVVAHSQTYVSGFINANTNWTVANMPYIVTGNTLVSIGYTLTIDPGVLVKFNTNTALQVDGQLIAIGTAANHIVFTSNQASPHAGDWGKLHIGDNSIDAVYDINGHYLSGTILKYCDVLYAGGVSFGAVHIESASPYISHCNIEHSLASGIYCVGSSYILDSSLVNDCAINGLYFDQIQLNSCGLIVRTDTIKNNKQGGMYLQASPGCSTIIENNYFISNNSFGGIYFNNTVNNATISANYFISNTGYGAIAVSNSYQIGNARINNNYFLKNVTSINNYGIGIVTFPHYSNITVAENYFQNDTVKSEVPGYPAGILSMNDNYSGGIDTVECNIFLNNETEGYGYGAIFMYCGGHDIITNNIFDGNVNNFTTGFSVAHISSAGNQNYIVSFTNNQIRNNVAPLSTVCYFIPYLSTNSQLLHIDHNEFTNNSAKNVIYLDGFLTNNSNFNFLYMKHNNFMDATNHIEFYDKIPYGSPNVYADSNYWGSTNTQHIDSIIYDYFDTANYSVVYYLPILTQAVEIDTSCSLGFPTTLNFMQKDADASKPFPNPFSVNTQIDFANELKDATLLLYNVFGQKVREMKGINGKHITVNRDNLPEGIYIYEVIEKQKRISNGKLMVE